MRHIILKITAVISILILCFCLLTACSDSYVKNNDSEKVSVSENYNETTNQSTTEGEENSKSANETATTPESSITTDDIEQTTDNENEDTTTTKQENQTTSCSHSTTKVVNKTSATCTTAGYTGDTYCTKCNKKVATGSQIKATGHKNTEIRNQKSATTSSEGYTGDTYCKDCGAKTATGKTTPKIEENRPGQIKYTSLNGDVYWVDKGVNITEYTMSLKTKKTTHLFEAAEKEILRQCNEERAKVGLAPLIWYEDAYYFTLIRAKEAKEVFSHTRPNSKMWHTVYSDAGVILDGTCGENLFLSEGCDEDTLLNIIVQEWMDSPGHRANILNPNYKKIAIAIHQDGIVLSVAQNFFG